MSAGTNTNRDTDSRVETGITNKDVRNSDSSPVVFPVCDSEFVGALLADVSLAPLWLTTEKVEQSEQQLLGGNLKVKWRKMSSLTKKASMLP